jgi:hypothetical protein
MDARRSARIATQFAVCIDGIDDAPVLRAGDVSTTGIYFETDKEVGGVGTIHWLRVTSADALREVHAMAYVARTVKLQDAHGARLAGVAFEFMPESEDAIEQLNEFVRYVFSVRNHEGEDPRVTPRLKARAEDGPATVRELSVRSMVLETSWAVQPGEPVRVDIVAPGMTRRIRLEGRAVRVNSKDKERYNIEVEVQQEKDRPLRHHSSMTMAAVRPEEHLPPPEPMRPSSPDYTQTLDDLLSALILPSDQPRARAHHLSGQLARIKLPTLFSLIDMEKMSGQLVLHHGIEEVRIYLKEGRILDVEPLAERETPRARIAQLVQWEDGSFELYEQPVERPDRVETSIMALLLDLAREADEAKRIE